MIKTEQQCRSCKKSISGKKQFCNNSCAASYNNTKYPKRKPEGNCKHCGISIPSSKRFCEKCKVDEEQKKFERSENIHTFLGPNGEFKKKLPSTYCHSELVFSSSFSKTMNAETTGQEVVLSLLSLLTEKPPYIVPADIRWLSAMLIHLLETDIDYQHFQNKTSNIYNIPVYHLSSYLEQWVRFFFRKGHHPLLPTFALITCQFIDKHLFGYNQWHSNNNDEPAWKLEAWANDSDFNFNQRRVRFLNDKTFKKEFTEQMGTLYLTCRIPENDNIIIPHFIDQPISTSSELIIEIQRCHLSQHIPSLPIYHHTQRLNEPKFNIFEDAELSGLIFSLNEEIVAKSRDIEAKIPINWVTGVKLYNPHSTILPLPEWLTK